MDLFITTLESVIVLLGIGLLGFWIIKKGFLPSSILGLLSPLAIEIALPSLIFAKIITTFSPEKYPNWWQLPLWWGFYTIIALILTLCFMFVSKKELRREFAVSLFYQNGLFFPLAIFVGMFPDDPSYIVYLFFFTLFYPVLLFSTYHLFFPKKEKISINWKKIIHPVLLATIIAIVISSIGIHVDENNFIVRIFVLLGGMTIPLLMIILGGNIYVDFQKKGQLKIKEIIKFVFIKNFIFPLIFLGILAYIQNLISYQVALIIILQSAVPPVTAVPILVQRVDGNHNIVNQFIVASFIISLLSIPIMITLFTMIFTA